VLILPAQGFIVFCRVTVCFHLWICIARTFCVYVDAATIEADDANRYRLGWAEHSTAFTCTARGLPVPDVAWLRGNSEYIASDNIYTIATTTDNQKVTSLLQVATCS